MSFRYVKYITRQMMRAEPTTLFVFGDNLAQVGYGGQAKEMRGEPNAVGIPTKRKPSRTAPDEFFTDNVYFRPDFSRNFPTNSFRNQIPNIFWGLMINSPCD